MDHQLFSLLSGSWLDGANGWHPKKSKGGSRERPGFLPWGVAMGWLPFWSQGPQLLAGSPYPTAYWVSGLCTFTF